LYGTNAFSEIFCDVLPAADDWRGGVHWEDFISFETFSSLPIAFYSLFLRQTGLFSMRIKQRNDARKTFPAP
jgi:hypothetical protein